MTTPDRLPRRLTALIELLTASGHCPTNVGIVETMLAPEACPGCRGTVWYPYDSAGTWAGGTCRKCGPVKLVDSGNSLDCRFEVPLLSR